MRHGSLFSGIGGFDLAAEWMGWENVFHCEWNQFGQKVLKYYWPNAVSYDDICKTDFTIWNGRIDILTGGFPCQPYSMAGKRQGTEDARHLWPEMCRAIRECRPTWIVGENVPGLINWSGGLVFEQVCADLEGEGYEVQPIVLPASGVNAPHRRDRVWFIAYCNDNGSQRRNGNSEGGNSRQSSSKGIGSGLQHEVVTNGKYGPTQNTNENGRRGDERKEESSIGRFGDIGAGDNERVRTDHAETWVKVVFAADCIYEEWDTDRECPTCPECGSDYSECECPGPTMDEYEYKVEGGIMYARLITDTSTEGLQGRELNGTPNEEGQIGREQPPRPITKRHKVTDWTDWPTVAPIRHVNDGVSGIMVRNIKSEVYGKISENYAAEDLQKVWDCFQSEEVREQIRGLYKIYGEGILLKTLQLCQTPNIGQGEFSPFGEDASKGLLRKLSKYGEFGRSPQGLELEKQFTGQFGNTLPYLSHEIALAAKEIEKECIKFASWHRNESIKAGGNAIVPQVALQIFKVIEQMRHGQG